MPVSLLPHHNGKWGPMKRLLLAGLCALALTACQATDQSDAGAAATAGSAVSQQQPYARIAGVPVTMLVPPVRPTRQGERLSDADLQQLLIGNTIKQVDDQYWAYFAPGGQLRGLLVNLTETGYYSLNAGTLCKVWPTWATGMQLCYQVVNLGDQRYRFTGLGVDSFDVVVSRGNPQAL